MGKANGKCTHIVFGEYAGGVDGLDGGPLADGDHVGDAGPVGLVLAHAAAERVRAGNGWKRRITFVRGWRIRNASIP